VEEATGVGGAEAATRGVEDGTGSEDTIGVNGDWGFWDNLRSQRDISLEA